MGNIKKEDCPFCDGVITFKEYINNEFSFNCNKCSLYYGGVSSEEDLDSQFLLLKNISKK